MQFQAKMIKNKFSSFLRNTGTRWILNCSYCVAKIFSTIEVSFFMKNVLYFCLHIALVVCIINLKRIRGEFIFSSTAIAFYKNCLK